MESKNIKLGIVLNDTCSIFQHIFVNSIIRSYFLIYLGYPEIFIDSIDIIQRSKKISFKFMRQYVKNNK